MDKKARINWKSALVITLWTLTVFYVVSGANTGSLVVGATISNVMMGPPIGPTTIAVTEAGITAVAYSFYIEDPQGIANINNDSAAGNISLNGLEYQATCTGDIGINTTTQNYSCTVNINYYDNATTWNYFVEGGNYNLTNKTAQSTFTYNVGNYINVSKADGNDTLSSWASTWYPKAINILSNDDPILISQRGNTYSTNIGVTAIGLTATGISDYVPAANFTVNTADACEGTAMVNATETQVAGAYLPNGVAGTTENTYLCMEDVPDIVSTTYTSPDTWTVTVN